MMTKRVDPRVMAEATAAAAKVIGADWDDPGYWTAGRGRWGAVRDAAPKPKRPPASLTDRSKVIRDFVDEYWARRRRRRRTRDELSEQAFSHQQIRERNKGIRKDGVEGADDTKGSVPKPPSGLGISAADLAAIQRRHYDSDFGWSMTDGLTHEVEGSVRKKGNPPLSEAEKGGAGYRWDPQRQPAELSAEPSEKDRLYHYGPEIPSIGASSQAQHDVLRATNVRNRKLTAAGFWGGR
jgi:hypothetical protein